MNWSEVLNRKALRDLAGGRSYSAGEGYASAGMVSSLTVGERTITAQVQGTERYRVKLSLINGEPLAGDCSCPYADEGNFCKHCVAVGLVYLDSDPNTLPPGGAWDGIRHYLKSLPPTELISLLMAQVEKDGDLQEELLLKVAQSAPNGPNIAALQKAIDRAIAVPDYLDYDEMSGYADGVERVVRSLADLLKRGFAKETRNLVEYAIGELRGAMNEVDDSNGEVGGVWQNLHSLHFEATLQAPVPPNELAEWLFQRELTSDWDIDVDWQDYLPALGKVGEAAFRQKAETMWATVPERKASDTRSYSSDFYRITRLMESLARTDNNAQRLIEIKKRDLSSPYFYLRIAELYLEMGKQDVALDWAEKGKAGFPNDPDSRVLDFLITQYTIRNRFAEAYQILWESFVRVPGLTHYQALHDYATARKEWNVWRGRAWETLRASLNERQSQPKSSFAWSLSSNDHSELVTILLWEKRSDEAWEEAKAGGCSHALWLQLAKARETSHPEDAVTIYSDAFTRSMKNLSGSDYSEPVAFLRKVRDILTATGQTDRLRTLMAVQRVEHKRKRNFLKELEKHHLP